MIRTEYSLDFCNEFAYPEEVRGHFERILDCVDKQNTVSVLLVGSTSRGELTCGHIVGKFTVFSDYEFFVVSRCVTVAERQRLRRAFDKLEGEFDAGPLFHIDFNLVSEAKLTRLPRTLFTYEAKARGITIWGNDLRTKLPTVSLGNINKRELNEIIIWRLWSLLLHLPARQLRARGAAQSMTDYRYVVCKNALDLTSWLVPLEGKLLPSFRERVRSLTDTYTDLSCSAFMGSGFPKFLGQCLNGKISLHFETDAWRLYAQAIDCFGRAFSFLSHKHNIQVGPNDDMAWLEHNSTKLFRDNDLKRRLYDCHLGVQKAAANGPRQVVRWFRHRKHGLVCATLYLMHRSFIAFAQGNLNSAIAKLEQSELNLALLALAPSKAGLRDSTDFLALWLEVRAELAEFMTWYFPWIRSQKNHVETVLEQQYA